LSHGALSSQLTRNALLLATRRSLLGVNAAVAEIVAEGDLAELTKRKVMDAISARFPSVDMDAKKVRMRCHALLGLPTSSVTRCMLDFGVLPNHAGFVEGCDCDRSAKETRGRSVR